MPSKTKSASDAAIGPGDVVQLRSGGPPMTVFYIEAADGVDYSVCHTIWHVDDPINDFRRDSFPIHMLKRV